jgi:hypothetical protein
MRATIYQTTGYITRSVIRAAEVASMEIDNDTDEEQLVQQHDGDFIEITSENPGEEHE